MDVMQVMDNTCTPLPVKRIEADKVVGVAVADRVVMFSRDNKAITEGFVFEIPKSAGKKVKVLMTDLAEGKWTISNARRKVVTTEDVKADSGVLYFTAEPGKYSLTR